MYAFPQVGTYKKILRVLLVINLLCGAYLILDSITSGARFIALVLLLLGIAASVFYLVLLVTLIDYVEYLDTRLGRMQDQLIRLEGGAKPGDGSGSPRAELSGRSRGKLSDRLGRL